MKPPLRRVSRPIRLFARISVAGAIFGSIYLVAGPAWLLEAFGVGVMLLVGATFLLFLLLILGGIGLGICSFFTWWDTRTEIPAAFESEENRKVRERLGFYCSWLDKGARLRERGGLWQ